MLCLRLITILSKSHYNRIKRVHVNALIVSTKGVISKQRIRGMGVFVLGVELEHAVVYADPEHPKHAQW